MARRDRGRRRQVDVEQRSQQRIVPTVEVLGIGAWRERKVVIERPLQVVLWELEGILLRLAEPLGVEPRQGLVERQRLLWWRPQPHDSEGPLFVERARSLVERQQGVEREKGVVRWQPVVRVEP